MASPVGYLESTGSLGPTNKHVLYVEVVPSGTLNLLQASEIDNDQYPEDPLFFADKLDTASDNKILWKKHYYKNKKTDHTSIKKEQSDTKLERNSEDLHEEIFDSCADSIVFEESNVIPYSKTQSKGSKKLKRNKNNRIKVKQKKVRLKENTTLDCKDILELSSKHCNDEFDKLKQNCFENHSVDDNFTENNSLDFHSHNVNQNGSIILTQNGSCISKRNDCHIKNENGDAVAQDGHDNTNENVVCDNKTQNGEKLTIQRRKKSKDFTSSLYSCKMSSECNFVASILSELNKHKKECHKDVKEFQCHECLYRGSTASDLRKHSRQHSGEMPYVCGVPECDFKAKHNNSLVYHMKKYHPCGDPLRCKVEHCDYSSHVPGSMRLHVLMRHGPGKTLCCELCPYKCYLMADLRKHQRVHTGDSPYKCSKCSYQCKISSNLKKHIRTHTMEQPYHCNQCHFKTNFINSLKVHRRTHSNERPYSCSHCSYKCNHVSNLKKHIQRLHPGSIHTTSMTKHYKEP